MVSIDLSDPDRSREGREVIRDLVGAYLGQEQLSGEEAEAVLLRAYEQFQGSGDSALLISRLFHALQESALLALGILGGHAIERLQVDDPGWQGRYESDMPEAHEQAVREFAEMRRTIWNAHLTES